MAESPNNIPRSAPIGIFDSGLGGLTVVKAFWDLIPNLPVIYLADNLHCPYGGRPLEEIVSFATDISRFLASNDLQAIVMGCNISSAVALEAVQNVLHPLPVSGLIQAAAEAAAAVDGPVLVLATQGTVRSGRYHQEILAHNPQATVWEIACPDFVPLVESGRGDSEEAFQAARAALRRAPGQPAAVVFGCTHYPLMADAIATAAGPNVILLDPAEIIARHLAPQLSAPSAHLQTYEPANFFYATGDLEQFEELASRILGREIQAQQADLWSNQPQPIPAGR
jgi:glutamate racemase